MSYMKPATKGSFGSVCLAMLLAAACSAGDDAGWDVRADSTGAGDMDAASADSAQPGDGTVNQDLEEPVPGPELEVSPATLDFGWVAVGDAKTLQVTVFNTGELPLTIFALAFADGSNPDLEVKGVDELPLLVPSGANRVFEVSFAPKTLFAATPDPIGSLRLSSNDPDESTLPILTYANIDAPFIGLDPSDKVEFGVVAKEWTIERTLTVTNVGHAPLKLSGVEVVVNTEDNEFAVVPGTAQNGEFAGETTLSAGEGVVVRFAFTNHGPMNGYVAGKCKFVSNDPMTPEVLLDLHAVRGGDPECKLQFAPPKLEFGTVAHGATKTGTMFVKNTGSGYCTWKSGVIRDCTSFMGLMTQCTATGLPSSLFKLIAPPIPVTDGIGPGATIPIEIQFTPPATIPFIPKFEEYDAWLQVTYQEPYSTGSYVDHKLPEPNAQGSVKSNLHAASGVADIAVLPGGMEFGLTTIGCESRTLSVKVYNAGTAPLQITDIYLDGCGPEFALKDYPPLPVDVNPSTFKEVSAVYKPQDSGSDACYLVIESSDLGSPLVKIPLSGEGTWDTEHTDTFTQVSGRKADILLVIDESASMCDELEQLSSNIVAFSALVKQWDIDIQVGITLTNIDADYQFDNGTSKAGALVGDGPRYLNSALIAALPGVVKALGCNGSGKQESGLEAGRRALSPPTITDTNIPCTCGDDQPCPGVCAEELLCVNGKCGGYNRGFLRHDASLEVVFMSDEEDQSPGSVPFYIDFFKSIKGFLNTSMFHAHAIVGDAGNGCNGNGSYGNAGADGGDRYIAVQQETGGKWCSICDSTFDSVLAAIGQQVLGSQVQFFLAAQADPTPGNIRVWVDGGSGYEECLEGWEYHQPTNSVVFQEAGACMPLAGENLKISYKMSCTTAP